ncbi:hypothetical protein [Lysobacter fragariae]
MRLIKILMSLSLLVLAACSNIGTPANKLDQSQYAWSAAIRWGDFEGAISMIDPKIREKTKVSAAEMERYKQVQISAYRDLGASADVKGGKAVRDIEIGVINRYNMTERTVRYREVWRWDEEGKTWWLTSSLPDLWDGQ